MRRLKLTTTLLLAAMAASPAGWAAQFGDYKPAGFLSDYSKLKPKGGGSEAYSYRDPSADMGKYDKLMVDRIKVYLKEDAPSKQIDPAELKELADYFHQAIVKAVEPAYPVVNEPGPDVLRVRVAITDLVPNAPEASVVTLVVPFVWVGEAGAGVAKGKAGSTPFIGEATVEAEALDSASSKQLAAYIEERVGKKYNWTQGVDTAVKDYVKAYSTWAYTKQAMDQWAQGLRKALDRWHGKATPEKQ
jgi:hypothetical protein